jgi:translation elongation factor EF-Tu-like GTPase
MITLLANIKLYSCEIGRNMPFTSGYRPLFNFKKAPTKTSGRIDLIGVENFQPGSLGVVKITFVEGIINSSYFKAGEKFTFDEGRVRTGEGEFLEVVRQWTNR